MRKAQPKKCVICNQPYSGYGHNADPVKPGRCCDVCNDISVLSARFRQAGIGIKKEAKK
jgi:hypothetical protein